MRKFVPQELADEMVKFFHTMDEAKKEVIEFERNAAGIEQQRFILRTGIFHYCSPRDSDPLAYKDVQKALVIFCGKYLSGSAMENIDLGKAPGIVEDFIWSFCAENGYNICGAEPKCHGCPLGAVCLSARARDAFILESLSS